MQFSGRWKYQLITNNESPCIKLTGDFTLAALESKYDLLSSELTHHRKINPNVHWDLIDIQQMDMASVIMLWQVWQAQRPTNLHIRPEHEIMFNGEQPFFICPILLTNAPLYVANDDFSMLSVLGTNKIDDIAKKVIKSNNCLQTYYFRSCFFLPIWVVRSML